MRWFKHGSFDPPPPYFDNLLQTDRVPVAYVRTPQRDVQCGIGCHICGSDSVSEYEEVDAHDWNKVTNILYVCHDCQASWSYKVNKGERK